MKTMILNPRKEKNCAFVLVEVDNDVVVAIITANEDEDCIDKVEEAIKGHYVDIEDLIFNKIEFDHDTWICIVEFEVTIIEEGEESVRDYKLIKTAVY